MTTAKKLWVVYTNDRVETWTDCNGNIHENRFDYLESFFDKDKAISEFKSFCKNSSYTEIYLKEIDLETNTIVDLSNTFNGNVLKIAGNITSLLEKVPNVIRTSSRLKDNQNITISVSVAAYDECKTTFDIIVDKIMRDNKEVFNNTLANIKVMVNSKKYKEFKNL